jgi:hypothetical protein
MKAADGGVFGWFKVGGKFNELGIFSINNFV